MKLLFVGPGFPGAMRTASGSGIGTYLRELTVGLQARGHECHVLVWRLEGSADGGQRESLFRVPDVATQIVEGVTVHALPHAYWPLIERRRPDSRDVYDLRRTVARLVSQHRFDVIEIESEEGVSIGVEKEFAKCTILSVHTTLSQMIRHKSVPIDRKAKYRLAREGRSLRIARRVLAHSLAHAGELRAEYPFLRNVGVAPLGLNVSSTTKEVTGPVSGGLQMPRFLVVGTPDLRKGFDRLRGILETFGARHGPCRCVVVSACNEATKRAFKLLPPFSNGVVVEWRSGLTAGALSDEYAQADVLLHPARYESFGLPLIEAAAMGTPIVATETGVVGELLDGVLSRFVIDADDPDSCATALRAAVQERARIAPLLQDRYAKRFTRERMVSEYLEYLREAGLLPRKGIA